MERNCSCRFADEMEERRRGREGKGREEKGKEASIVAKTDPMVGC